MSLKAVTHPVTVFFVHINDKSSIKTTKLSLAYYPFIIKAYY